MGLSLPKLDIEIDSTLTLLPLRATLRYRTSLSCFLPSKWSLMLILHNYTIWQHPQPKYWFGRTNDSQKKLSSCFCRFAKYKLFIHALYFIMGITFYPIEPRFFIRNSPNSRNAKRELKFCVPFEHEKPKIHYVHAARAISKSFAHFEKMSVSLASFYSFDQTLSLVMILNHYFD